MQRDSAPLLALALVVAALSLRAVRAHSPPATPQAFAKTAEPRLSAAAAALRDGRPLDLNEATATDLELLPRVGPAIAGRIVEARPFDSVDDLLRVRGIGPRTLARLRPMVMVSPTAIP
ncbi:MAG: helix-hairpin-helix domain-containing protein [Myxococcota bacterium]